MQEFVLGIDTSNYKTSIALVSRCEIICDFRKFLMVKEGERGLRQSEALFQHINNLPELFEELGDSYRNQICAVACSDRPRSVEGSYMPCFLAGRSFAKSISSILGVPVFEFSHQDGHVEAVRRGSGFNSHDDFIACHFSGGTCEVLKVQQEDKDNSFYDMHIIGGTKDISFGQVIDRAGVKMGFSFPCGEEMDRIAFACDRSSDVLTPIKVRDGQINLSGIDTQIMRFCESMENPPLIKEIFDRLADAIIRMLLQTADSASIRNILMSGGVSSSAYLRKRILADSNNLNIIFDENNLSSDNAVGTAFLGSRALWE